MDWLKELRTEKGMTQAQVAEMANMERAYYSMIEIGLRRPSPEIAIRIGNALGFEWTRFYSDLAENNGGANVN